MTKEQELFWKQYDGMVKAIDLPTDYKLLDERIYCVNKDCYVRNKCEFWKRFEAQCKTFGSSHGKMMYRAIKRDQKGWNRCDWDKNYPNPDYRNASFGFYAEQSGTKPCSCYAEIGAYNKD